MIIFFLQYKKNKSHIDLVVEEIVDDSVEPLLRVAHIWQLESEHETEPWSPKKMNSIGDKTICMFETNSLFMEVLRIRDVYPGSRIFDPGSNNNTKEEGKQYISCLNHKFRKIVKYLIF